MPLSVTASTFQPSFGFSPGAAAFEPSAAEVAAALAALQSSSNKPAAAAPPAAPVSWASKLASATNNAQTASCAPAPAAPVTAPVSTSTPACTTVDVDKHVPPAQPAVKPPVAAPAPPAATKTSLEAVSSAAAAAVPTDGAVLRYTRDFFYSLRAQCTAVPACLNLCPEFARGGAEEAPVRRGGAKRKGKKSDEPLRDKEGRVVEVAPLVKSASRWVPVKAGELTDDDSLVFKKARGILNKLTPEKYDKLLLQFIECGVTSSSVTRGLVDAVFVKATHEHCFTNLYAAFCVDVAERLPATGDGSETFASLTLDRMRHELTLTVEAPPADAEEEVLVKHKQRQDGKVKFAAALYVRGLLPGDEAAAYLRERMALLVEEGNEVAGEAVCLFLEGAGRRLEERDPTLTDALLAGLTATVEAGRLTMRSKFMFMALRELRENGWRARRAREVAPQKIDHATKEALAAKSQEKHEEKKEKERLEREKRRRANDKRRAEQGLGTGWVTEPTRGKRSVKQAPGRGAAAAAETSTEALVLPATPLSRFALLDDEGEDEDGVQASDEELTDCAEEGYEGTPPSAALDDGGAVGSPSLSRAATHPSGQSSGDDLSDDGALPKSMTADAVARLAQAKVKGLLDELVCTHEGGEALVCVEEAAAATGGAHALAPTLALEALLALLDLAPKEGDLVLDLLCDCHARGLVDAEVVATAAAEALSMLDDIKLDIPLAPERLARACGALAARAVLDLPQIAKRAAAAHIDVPDSFLASARELASS